ncbi:hypothetical protein FRUB_04172 [Fimbriiglobus ruber]|uniref:Uncharacterized protein n=1 Tax=Fimbriiglobus ruber TaxID=1908690 RepID=A0A225DR32_9BACT|nr:hypothetical protein FRUB_04172 [Fimbriiglobus ruber]
MAPINPVEFQAQCETTLAQLTGLLEAAGRKQTTAELAKLIRQLPHSPDWLKDFKPDTLLTQCVRDAAKNKAAWNKGNSEKFSMMLKSIAELNLERRAILEAALIGCLARLDHGSKNADPEKLLREA